MKKVILLSISAIFCISITMSAQTSQDTTAIKQASLDYLEGWYSGDTDRMEKALHPNLVKRRIATLPQTGADIIDQVSAASMVEYTKAGIGKKQAEEGQTNEVIILDIYKGIASVKAVSKDYIDYLHIGKVNEEWKILNVLWDVNKK